ncbi:MAG: S1 RNA-binding domain-containing protein, partial [Acidobacteriaceae bacterium]
LLDKMDAVIGEANTEKSEFAPRIHTLQIPVDKIRDLIGPGGKTIRGIVEATGVKIDVDDTGKVNIASSDADGLRRAIETVSNLTAVPEVGKTYLGKVVRLAEFGAFVEIFPGTDGLLHISEIAEHRVHEVTDELNDGDQVLVKVLGIEGNRIKLSRKAVLKEQRIKLGLPDPNAGGGHVGDVAAAGDRQPSSNGSTIVLESGDDFGDEGGESSDAPNFNRADSPRPPSSPGGRGPGGGNNRRRRRPGGGGGRPGGGGGRR